MELILRVEDQTNLKYRIINFKMRKTHSSLKITSTKKLRHCSTLETDFQVTFLNCCLEKFEWECKGLAF